MNDDYMNFDDDLPSSNIRRTSFLHDDEDDKDINLIRKDRKDQRRKRISRHRRSPEKHSDDINDRDDDMDDNPNNVETIYLKEFDMNSIPPQKVSDNSGVKIVVIGKPGCFAPGTEVLMYNGSIKKVEDVIVGDILMGDDNTPRIVQELFANYDDMYSIILNDSNTYIVNKLHDLVLVRKNIQNLLDNIKNHIIEISVYDYINDNSFKNNWCCYKLKKSSLNTEIDINTIIVKDFYLHYDIYDFTVELQSYGQYFGFSLDKNRRFLLSTLDVCRNTGKSTIIQDIVASKAHIAPVAQIFSGTEDSNGYYGTKFPGCCVYNSLNMDAIKNFIVRQKMAKEHLPNPWAVQIVDDCTDNPRILTDPIFQAYYKNGRHWKMIHILSLQYCLDVRPNIRTNIDYTFILRETIQKNRKALWENYAGCIPSLNEFHQIMDAVTEDFTALVINNKVQSNKIEDCVFWYKAKPDRIPPNWKFGHKIAWEHHEKRSDPNYVAPLITH